MSYMSSPIEPVVLFSIPSMSELCFFFGVFSLLMDISDELEPVVSLLPDVINNIMD